MIQQTDTSKNPTDLDQGFYWVLGQYPPTWTVIEVTTDKRVHFIGGSETIRVDTLLRNFKVGSKIEHSGEYGSSQIARSQKLL